VKENSKTVRDSWRSTRSEW